MMPKNCLEVQTATISIPAPKFKFGETVQWQRILSTKAEYRFLGIVECRHWEDDPDETGQWRYYIKVTEVWENNKPRFYNYGGEEMQEAELTSAA